MLGGGVGLATGLVVALFPFAAIGGGLLVGTTAGGAVLGAVAGHAAAGMSRDDLKELGEQLDAGSAGLVVVAVSDMGAKVEEAMKRAEKLEQKELKADTDEIERDAAAAPRARASRAHRATGQRMRRTVRRPVSVSDRTVCGPLSRSNRAASAMKTCAVVSASPSAWCGRWTGSPSCAATSSRPPAPRNGRCRQSGAGRHA